jgi:L-alanine-DL-glutamate epimerase-like enolase superfamily enzyme
MGRIAGLAEALHVPVAPHLSAGLGSCIGATAHLNGVDPEPSGHRVLTGVVPAGEPELKQPMVCEGGHVVMPDGPGIGMEPVEAALREYEGKL